MRRKWLPVGGLLLLSLFWAVGWVRADLFPGAAASGTRLNALLSQAALLGVFAVSSGLAGAIGKKRWPRGSAVGRAVLVGIGLFVVPAVLTIVVNGLVDDTTRVALFSLTPLLAVVFEPYLGAGAQRDGEIPGKFPAAMLAVAGTFLVFPFEVPHSYAAAGALLGLIAGVASVAAANCIGVELVQGRGICPLTLGAISAGAAAILLGIAGLLGISGGASGMLSVWAVSDLCALALLFWLMRQMSALQMTTRFLIAPLLANMISLVLLRPQVEVQAGIGLAFIATAAAWLLWVPDRASESDSSLKLQ